MPWPREAASSRLTPLGVASVSSPCRFLHSSMAASAFASRSVEVFGVDESHAGSARMSATVASARSIPATLAQRMIESAVLEIVVAPTPPPAPVGPCRFRFPDPLRADVEGLLAEGGDLEPSTLVAAYRA